MLISKHSTLNGKICSYATLFHLFGKFKPVYNNTKVVKKLKCRDKIVLFSHQII